MVGLDDNLLHLAVIGQLLNTVNDSEGILNRDVSSLGRSRKLLRNERYYLQQHMFALNSLFTLQQGTTTSYRVRITTQKPRQSIIEEVHGS